MFSRNYPFSSLRTLAVGIAAGLLTALAATGMSQASPKGDLLLDDSFDGPGLGTSWTVTGAAPVVSGGAVTLSNGTDMQWSPGFLECPIIVELENVTFSNITGNGSSAGISFRTLGNGSVSVSGGSQSLSWYLSNTTYVFDYGYAQGGSAGLSPITSGPTYDQTPHTYTFAMETTRSLVYADNWTPGYSEYQLFPTPNSGKSTVGFNTNGTASVSCSRVRAWRAVPSPIRAVRFIERRTTATLDMSAIGLSLQSSNLNFTTYGTLTADKVTSTPPTLPRPALNNTIWNISMSPTNLSSVTTITHTFNVNDLVGAGIDPNSLTGYKSTNNGATWVAVPNCTITLNGANSLFTFGGQTSFSTFAIGYSVFTHVRDWELFE
ncbi:MAG: hypothetical protein ACR2IE_19365 [Candidatus Sumerlaeaceae bacterium]